VTDTPTYRMSRLFAGTGALLFTFFALRILLRLLGSPDMVFLRLIFLSTSGTAAVMCWWYALRGQKTESRAVMGSGCLSGLVVGGVAFIAGFVGPLLFMPGANQGPLFGILVTGPLGCVAGTAGGVIVAKLRRRNGQSDDGEAD